MFRSINKFARHAATTTFVALQALLGIPELSEELVGRDVRSRATAVEGGLAEGLRPYEECGSAGRFKQPCLFGIPANEVEDSDPSPYDPGLERRSVAPLDAPCMWRSPGGWGQRGADLRTYRAHTSRAPPAHLS